MSLPDDWGMSPAEIAETWPGDELPTIGVHHWHRGVDVDAPASVAFRWLCQLRVAPYSYDWIDNLGRRSPTTLTPDLDHLELDQGFMAMFRLVDFKDGEYITLGTRGQFFGTLWVTYRVVPDGDRCRMLARLRVPIRKGLGKVLNRALAWGDLIMMRKQLLTLASHAAQTQQRGRS